MMQSMKGATQILGSMNRSMNLPALQRIAMEFERENDIMDQRQEMMDDAIDDSMGVDEEAEGDEVIEQVLEEIGVDLRQAVSLFMVSRHAVNFSLTVSRWERHPPVFKLLRFRRVRSHKQLAAVVVLTLGMMISRLD